jgi:hypothetical protein
MLRRHRGLLLALILGHDCVVELVSSENLWTAIDPRAIFVWQPKEKHNFVAKLREMIVDSGLILV